MYTGADTGLSVGCISADKVRGERERGGRLSALGCLIKGLQGREQGKNNTHTLHGAAGIRTEPGREREEDERETVGEKAMESDRESQRGLNPAVFSCFISFCTASHKHITHRESLSITVIALRQNNIKELLPERRRHHQNLTKTARRQKSLFS